MSSGRQGKCKSQYRVGGSSRRNHERSPRHRRNRPACEWPSVWSKVWPVSASECVGPRNCCSKLGKRRKHKSISTQLPERTGSWPGLPTSGGACRRSYGRSKCGSYRSALRKCAVPPSRIGKCECKPWQWHSNSIWPHRRPSSGHACRSASAPSWHRRRGASARKCGRSTSLNECRRTCTRTTTGSSSTDAGYLSGDELWSQNTDGSPSRHTYGTSTSCGSCQPSSSASGTWPGFRGGPLDPDSRLWMARLEMLGRRAPS